MDDNTKNNAIDRNTGTSSCRCNENVTRETTDNLPSNTGLRCIIDFDNEARRRERAAKKLKKLERENNRRIRFEKLAEAVYESHLQRVKEEQLKQALKQTKLGTHLVAIKGGVMCSSTPEFSIINLPDRPSKAVNPVELAKNLAKTLLPKSKQLLKSCAPACRNKKVSEYVREAIGNNPEIPSTLKLSIEELASEVEKAIYQELGVSPDNKRMFLYFKNPS